MAHTFSPLSEDQITNLTSEITSLLEEEDEMYGTNLQEVELPTNETFNKSEILQMLRILEPNSIVFFQDIHKLILMYLDKNLASSDAEILKEKYLICNGKSNLGTNTITLRRIAAVFPSLTCNLLKCNNTSITRPISQLNLCESENYPRSMMTRCFFSLIPRTPIIGKMKLIEAALLYQLLEQAKFNTLKMENGEVNYPQHMQICLDYCSDDYLSEFEINERRIQHFDELELIKYGFPITPIYEAALRLKDIVGNKWTNEIAKKFQLTTIDFD